MTGRALFLVSGAVMQVTDSLGVRFCAVPAAEFASRFSMGERSVTLLRSSSNGVC